MAVKRYKGKKSLKQPDEFVTFSSRLLKQILLHRKKVLSVFGGLVAVGLILSGAKYLSGKADANAFLQLKQAVAQYESIQKEGDAPKDFDGVIKSLEKISGAYENKMGGKLANFFLAGCSFTAGDFSRAEALYRKAVKDFNGEVPFESLAKISLGYSLEQQGKHEEAAAVFSGMPADTGSIAGDESLFALSRQYGSMGNADKQLETVKKLIEIYPQSMYINVLREKFPDLPAPVQPKS